MTQPSADSQRRGRKIAMTADELDGFLAEQRTCRVATVGRDGAPHVTPLWFVWDGEHLWLNSVVNSQRWTNLARDPRVAIAVDDGVGFLELRGAELEGTVAPVGAIPSPADGATDDAARAAEHLWSAKYMDGARYRGDGRHAWLRVTVTKVASWDFRKLGA